MNTIADEQHWNTFEYIAQEDIKAGLLLVVESLEQKQLGVTILTEPYDLSPFAIAGRDFKHGDMIPPDQLITQMWSE